MNCSLPDPDNVKKEKTKLTTVFSSISSHNFSSSTSSSSSSSSSTSQQAHNNALGAISTISLRGSSSSGAIRTHSANSSDGSTFSSSQSKVSQSSFTSSSSFSSSSASADAKKSSTGSHDKADRQRWEEKVAREGTVIREKEFTRKKLLTVEELDAADMVEDRSRSTNITIAEGTTVGKRKTKEEENDPTIPITSISKKEQGEEKAVAVAVSSPALPEEINERSNRASIHFSAAGAAPPPLVRNEKVAEERSTGLESVPLTRGTENLSSPSLSAATIATIADPTASLPLTSTLEQEEVKEEILKRKKMKRRGETKRKEEGKDSSSFLPIRGENNTWGTSGNSTVSSSSSSTDRGKRWRSRGEGTPKRRNSSPLKREKDEGVQPPPLMEKEERRAETKATTPTTSPPVLLLPDSSFISQVETRLTKRKRKNKDKNIHYSVRNSHSKSESSSEVMMPSTQSKTTSNNNNNNNSHRNHNHEGEIMNQMVTKTKLNHSSPGSFHPKDIGTDKAVVERKVEGEGIGGAGANDENGEGGIGEDDPPPPHLQQQQQQEIKESARFLYPLQDHHHPHPHPHHHSHVGAMGMEKEQEEEAALLEDVQNLVQFHWGSGGHMMTSSSSSNGGGGVVGMGGGTTTLLASTEVRRGRTRRERGDNGEKKSHARWEIRNILQCTSSFFVLLYQRMCEPEVQSNIFSSPKTPEQKRRNVELVLMKLAEGGVDVKGIEAVKVVQQDVHHIRALIRVFVDLHKRYWKPGTSGRPPSAHILPMNTNRGRVDSGMPSSSSTSFWTAGSGNPLDSMTSNMMMLASSSYPSTAATGGGGGGGGAGGGGGDVGGMGDASQKKGERVQESMFSPGGGEDGEVQSPFLLSSSAPATATAGISGTGVEVNPSFLGEPHASASHHPQGPSGAGFPMSSTLLSSSSLSAGGIGGGPLPLPLSAGHGVGRGKHATTPPTSATHSTNSTTTTSTTAITNASSTPSPPLAPSIASLAYPTTIIVPPSSTHVSGAPPPPLTGTSATATGGLTTTGMATKNNIGNGQPSGTSPASFSSSLPHSLLSPFSVPENPAVFPSHPHYYYHYPVQQHRQQPHHHHHFPYSSSSQQQHRQQPCHPHTSRRDKPSSCTYVQHASPPPPTGGSGSRGGSSGMGGGHYFFFPPSYAEEKYSESFFQGGTSINSGEGRPRTTLPATGAVPFRSSSLYNQGIILGEGGGGGGGRGVARIHSPSSNTPGYLPGTAAGAPPPPFSSSTSSSSPLSNYWVPRSVAGGGGGGGYRHHHPHLGHGNGMGYTIAEVSVPTPKIDLFTPPSTRPLMGVTTAINKEGYTAGMPPAHATTTGTTTTTTTTTRVGGGTTSAGRIRERTPMVSEGIEWMGKEMAHSMGSTSPSTLLLPPTSRTTRRRRSSSKGSKTGAGGAGAVSSHLSRKQEVYPSTTHDKEINGGKTEEEEEEKDEQNTMQQQKREGESGGTRDRGFHQVETSEPVPAPGGGEWKGNADRVNSGELPPQETTQGDYRGGLPAENVDDDGIYEEEDDFVEDDEDDDEENKRHLNAFVMRWRSEVSLHPEPLPDVLLPYSESEPKEGQRRGRGEDELRVSHGVGGNGNRSWHPMAFLSTSGRMTAAAPNSPPLSSFSSLPPPPGRRLSPSFFSSAPAYYRGEGINKERGGPTTGSGGGGHFSGVGGLLASPSSPSPSCPVPAVPSPGTGVFFAPSAVLRQPPTMTIRCRDSEDMGDRRRITALALAGAVEPPPPGGGGEGGWVGSDGGEAQSASRGVYRGEGGICSTPGMVEEQVALRGERGATPLSLANTTTTPTPGIGFVPAAAAAAPVDATAPAQTTNTPSASGIRRTATSLPLSPLPPSAYFSSSPSPAIGHEEEGVEPEKKEKRESRSQDEELLSQQQTPPSHHLCLEPKEGKSSTKMRRARIEAEVETGGMMSMKMVATTKDHEEQKNSNPEKGSKKKSPSITTNTTTIEERPVLAVGRSNTHKLNKKKKKDKVVEGGEEVNLFSSRVVNEKMQEGLPSKILSPPALPLACTTSLTTTSTTLQPSISFTSPLSNLQEVSQPAEGSSFATVVVVPPSVSLFPGHSAAAVAGSGNTSTGNNYNADDEDKRDGRTRETTSLLAPTTALKKKKAKRIRTAAAAATRMPLPRPTAAGVAAGRGRKHTGTHQHPPHTTTTTVSSSRHHSTASPGRPKITCSPLTAQLSHPARRTSHHATPLLVTTFPPAKSTISRKEAKMSTTTAATPKIISTILATNTATTTTTAPNHNKRGIMHLIMKRGGIPKDGRKPRNMINTKRKVSARHSPTFGTTTSVYKARDFSTSLEPKEKGEEVQQQRIRHSPPTLRPLHRLSRGKSRKKGHHDDGDHFHNRVNAEGNCRRVSRSRSRSRDREAKRFAEAVRNTMEWSYPDPNDHGGHDENSSQLVQGGRGAPTTFTTAPPPPVAFAVSAPPPLTSGVRETTEYLPTERETAPPSSLPLSCGSSIPHFTSSPSSMFVWPSSAPHSSLLTPAVQFAAPTSNEGAVGGATVDPSKNAFPSVSPSSMYSPPPMQTSLLFSQAEVGGKEDGDDDPYPLPQGQTEVGASKEKLGEKGKGREDKGERQGETKRKVGKKKVHKKVHYIPAAATYSPLLSSSSLPSYTDRAARDARIERIRASRLAEGMQQHICRCLREMYDEQLNTARRSMQNREANWRQYQREQGKQIREAEKRNKEVYKVLMQAVASDIQRKVYDVVAGGRETYGPNRRPASKAAAPFAGPCATPFSHSSPIAAAAGAAAASTGNSAGADASTVIAAGVPAATPPGVGSSGGSTLDNSLLFLSKETSALISYYAEAIKEAAR